MNRTRRHNLYESINQLYFWSKMLGLIGRSRMKCYMQDTSKPLGVYFLCENKNKNEIKILRSI